MRPARHQGTAEQQHAEECRLQKEGHQVFVGQHGRDHVGGRVGEACPIGAELEWHDDAGDDAHGEGDREDADPEARDAQPDLVTLEEIQPLQNRDEGGEADGEGRQQDVPADHPGPLQT